MAKQNSITRRGFLRLTAAAAAGGLLAGCAPAATPTPTTAPTSAPAATAVPATALPPMVKGEIRIIPTTVKLPKDKVTFRWLDSGDTKAIFWKKYFELYQKAYPNITCQYDGLPWNEIAKIVPVGVQNSNLHDCFSLPQGVSASQAVAEGWIRPMDDLIPDIKEHKAKFPAGSFVEGVNVFGGKTYAFPHSTAKRSGTMLLYNEEYMKKAGYDPLAKRFTWSEYRAAAKKMTEQGAGKYYGVIIGGNQLNRWADVVRSLANIAGARGSGDNIDFKTGEYFFTSDQVIAAIELLLAIKSDGSFFPGFLSLTAPQARANISQGNAAMILQGLWCLPQWKTENPAISYGTALTPAPDTGTPSFVYAAPGGNNEMWIYSKSKVPEVAADILYYRTTLEGQYAWNKVAGVSDPGIFPQALETASSDPKDIKALQMQDSLFKIAPSPLVRNPETAKVSLELKAVTPSFEQVIQGLVSGQLTDVKKNMQSVKDAYEKELDRAIKAAVDKGAKVTRSDYAFPNFDPAKDYLDADYAGLK
ncbi:MAG TPA: extracellular solute-binding protein [Anaerolineaceae bacterium]